VSAGRTPRAEDGQHYSDSFYNPGMESGQKSSIRPAARVGMVSGGEQNMSVPKPARNAGISTTTGSAGPRAVGEVTHGDDK
jgi:hypothetical protein